MVGARVRVWMAVRVRAVLGVGVVAGAVLGAKVVLGARAVLVVLGARVVVLDVGTAVRVGARAGAAHLWVRALSAKMRTESGVLCFRILPILSLMTCRFIHTLTQTTPRARGTPLLMDAGPLHWVSGSALLLHGQEHRVFTEGASCQTRQQVSLCDCGCEFG